MKQVLFCLLLMLVPSVCLAQESTAFVDPENGVAIKTDLSGFSVGQSRTIHFNMNTGKTVQTDLPAGMGYIYIYNAETREGVIEFSRTDQYQYRGYLYDYSRHPCYGGAYRAYR